MPEPSMPMGGRWAPMWAALASFAVVAALVGASLRADGSTTAAAGTDTPSAQVVQLRIDEALGRVEVAINNRGPDPIVVSRLRLRVDGFSGGGWIAKDSPIPPGQVVDLPVKPTDKTRLRAICAF